MIVNVVSNIPYLKGVSGKHHIKGNQTIKLFLNDLGVAWDKDALVTLNGRICKGDEQLQDNDLIQLLVPIAGG